MYRLAMSLILMLAVSACVPAQDSPAPEPSQLSAPESSSQPGVTPVPEQAETRALPTKEQRLTPKPPAQIERVPGETQTFVIGEVPAELLTAIQADIIEKLGKQPVTVELLQAAMATWSDGSMGCAQPGMYYTQALVEGYQIIFVVDGETFDYRATNQGYFFRCEQSPLDRPMYITP